MTTTARRAPYIWTTWITGLLATDDSCRWAAWFKAHFTFTKVERDDSALTKWKAEHGDMVTARVAELRAEGWTVTIEEQNAFKQKGKKTGALLSGKPDIVATRGADALVVDCKSGTRKDKDFWQVAIYLVMLPLVRPEIFGGRRLVGELRYRDGALLIQPEEMTPDVRARISAQLLETGGLEPPDRVPSERECSFCDIGPHDCAARLELAAAAPATITDLF
jgi:Holliday junction resolvase